MGMRRKKKVGSRPQKVNMYNEDAGGIDIRVGYATAAAAGISGDAAVSCGLPGGSRALILSDGMGKGIKAAAGSRLVVNRLRRNLKAGMPVASAIKEVNRYMIEQAEGAVKKFSSGTDLAPSPKEGDTDFADDQVGGQAFPQDIQADGQAGTQAAQGGDQANPQAAQMVIHSAARADDHDDRVDMREEFATVDLTVIDRQSRRARFYKMGAATSFIMRGGRVRKIKGAALPVGIIPKLRLTHISAVLREGDLIVMVSDGITDADRNDLEARWLCSYLSEKIYSADFDAGRMSARQIAADILAEAEARYGVRERDDLTVAAALIVNGGTDGAKE